MGGFTRQACSPFPPSLPIPLDAGPTARRTIGTRTPIPKRPMAYPVLHLMG